MSLKFLTKRRDRNRSESATSNGTKNSSLDKSPAPSRATLPSSDSFLSRGSKAAAAPPEVQVISWHPDDLRSARRDVHIRSRGDDAPFKASPTPVYQAFTSRSAPTSRFMTKPSTARTEIDHAPSSSNASSSDIGHTFFGATDSLVLRNHNFKSPRRPRPRPGTAPLPKHPPPVTSQQDSASETPKSEDLEVLNPSSCPSPLLQQPESSTRPSVPVRHAGRPRHAKSRSYTSQAATHDAYDTDDPSSSFGLPFSSKHRNASVQSLISVVSTGARGSSSSQGDKSTTTSAGSSSGLLSRIPSRRRTRSKNASVSDVHAAFPPDLSAEAESQPRFRARSESFGALTTRLFRSKDQTMQAPTATTSPNKASRNAIKGTAAPPSAWRTDAIAPTAASGDDYAHDAGGESTRAPSMTYSSDNEVSVGHGSSLGHGVESGHRAGTTSPSRNLMSGSSSDHSGTATSLLFAGLKALGGGGGNDSTSNRFSTYSTKLTASPKQSTAPQSHFDHPSPVLDSPRVSGLPLPLATPSPSSSPGGTIFTAQLLKRIGPPPVGLAPECFHERVALVQNYILSQVPLPPLPLSPHSLPSDEDPIGKAASQRPSRESSLPLASRRSNTNPAPARSFISCVPMGKGESCDVTASLQDEFDKLECVAERELGNLVSTPFSQQNSGGTPARLVDTLQTLRLREVFLAARSRCGLDPSRSHFDLQNFAVTADQMARSDSSRRGTASAVNKDGSLGLGLRGITAHSPDMGQGIQMSLRPAPRRRRGTGSAAQRPLTAPGGAAQPMAYVCPDLPATVRNDFDGDLFTPQSFSAKLCAMHRPPTRLRSSIFEDDDGDDQDEAHNASSRDSSATHRSVESASIWSAVVVPVKKRSPVMEAFDFVDSI
ncbi:hypothetical protein PHSY_004993 [Pseudozyma hubeiensis SY62]|uniref:Uncharacterized protein n=1 Tax=Pseudozyma hubeiensis (strain SY62) TaxID=1305764 RepID=R9P7N9_PSEHS|nr:hypothetical protein PHSY_004993 [Pseudozyma hubeiensis SY62]GAC97408.1 hypothetical protein PHSY_004993 [Pseudozyma hubeiensis SY62]